MESTRFILHTWTLKIFICELIQLVIILFLDATTCVVEQINRGLYAAQLFDLFALLY
jgi:hypothetical protein